MKAVQTDRAPAAIGPYSQAIVHGGLVYCSGQVALSPEGDWCPGTAAEEARLALSNLSAVLESAGARLNTTLKVTVYLIDMSDFAEVNAVYAEFFADHRPARACVQAAALPLGARIEIDCVAALV